MIIGKPAPFVSTFVDAVDEVIREHNSGRGMSAIQRTWLAFCVTAVLVTNSICWARFERASLGTYSLAALSWMFRHSKMPWDELLVASVRVILRHYGLTCGSLVIDDTDNPRSKSSKALAHLYKLRDKERGGYVWGQSLVFLVLVTPKISIPVGFTLNWLRVLCRAEASRRSHGGGQPWHTRVVRSKNVCSSVAERGRKCA